MNKASAQVLGGITALLFMGYLFWIKAGPKPCPGGVFVEFQPPLTEPGPYRFRLSLDGAAAACEFDVTLPVSAAVDTRRCALALELKTQKRGSHSAISGLAFAASPKTLWLRVSKEAEPIYDQHLTMHYSPYPVRRDESRRFCGEQALIHPECLRGSSECKPYPASCTGPEDCPKPKVCCANPEFARDYGVRSATECTQRSSCLNRYGHIACHADSDCPKDAPCSDDSLALDFRPALRACKTQ